MKRALVSQTRIPEPDRDRGSQRVDDFIQYLLDDGWAVTFLAEQTDGEDRHASRLRQRGVAAFIGFEEAEAVVAAGDFDLALLAFWQPASKLLPLLRDRSPRTTVIIDSIDLHFLRDARRRFGVDGALDEAYGKLLAAELNTYHQADAVLTVSQKEASMLTDFLGPGKAFDLPLAEHRGRSAVPLDERRGMFFLGNFRHLPNGEAVEFLCRDVLPLLDPALLAAHPLTVVGNRLDDKILGFGKGLPHVNMVGWVPTVEPYLEGTRASIVPLLHGAGVKGKVVQSLLTGTPVVGTSIAVEGLDLEHDVHALVADTPEDLAAALTRILTDDDAWHRLADGGWQHAAAAHDEEVVRGRFLAIIDDALGRPPLVGFDLFRHGRQRAAAYRDTVQALQSAVEEVSEPGATVLVVSKGDDELVRLRARTGWHFPLGGDGDWAGFHPADSDAAIRHLEALRDRGARYLAFPSTSFWWLHHYEELRRYLDTRFRRVHADDQVIVFRLETEQRCPDSGRSATGDAEAPTVLVVGSYAADGAGPPPALVAALDDSGCRVTQRWAPGTGTSLAEAIESAAPEADADWIVAIDGTARVPHGFLDDLVAEVTRTGANRVQPTHRAGPGAGPPVTERLRGSVAREVATPTPLPVLAVRRGTAPIGPVLLLDRLAIGLAHALPVRDDPMSFSTVQDVIVRDARDGDDLRRALHRTAGASTPKISVLVSTYDRAELLDRCLDGFARQTVEPGDFEVIVVDDGSPGAATEEVLRRYADRLPLVWTRIEHAGRSAAKNLAALLGRADIVLFFDDDDRPAPDLLDEHLRAHAAQPAEGVAVLGFTEWSPELDVTPLMHYVTDVDKFLFAYGSLHDGQELDWKGFWEGRISCKRSLLVRHGLHDQRLDYSIDIEMAWRLAPHGLRVVYHPRARSYMMRSIDIREFCRRAEAKGRAQAAIADFHDVDELRKYARIEEAKGVWEAARPGFDALLARSLQLEQELAAAPDADLEELHRTYRALIQASNARGVAEWLDGATGPDRAAAAAAGIPTNGSGASRLPASPRSTAAPAAEPEQVVLTVTLPVWSRTEELADMAERTVDRIHEVACVPTEVLVVDNGSPHQRTFNAAVHRFAENRGVSVAWNTGIQAASAPVVAVLNSDCLVEHGWDEALLEAATTGRRIAFPYTDHGDGLGFRQPDQGGTAGWCFMLTLDTYREVGPFDERFSPAYGEDTDYWHRAWELGIELTPVPAARVSHARRTTARHDPHVEWLLMSHRYLYGWKHGVDPLRAPPYYNREIVEYHVGGLREGASR